MTDSMNYTLGIISQSNLQRNDSLQLSGQFEFLWLQNIFSPRLLSQMQYQHCLWFLPHAWDSSVTNRESMAADSKTLYIRDCQLEESMKKSKIAALGTVWIPVLRGFSEGVISEETAAWIFRYNQIQVSRSFGSDAHVPACINIATSSILMWLSVLTNTSCWFKDTPIH